MCEIKDLKILIKMMVGISTKNKKFYIIYLNFINLFKIYWI
jgi:hypothetical protein